MAEIKIPKKVREYRGDDGYKSFSIRIPDQLEQRLAQIAYQTDRSRNEVITMLLQQAVDNIKE